MNIADFTLKINSISVDTIPLFVQLAADTPSSYREIDLLYQTDKLRFQNAAKQSGYASHPLFTAGGIDRQIYAAKYLGIILAAIEDGFNSPLYSKLLVVMGKRWNTLNTYIANCTTIDLSEVIKPEYCPQHAQNPAQHNLLAGAAAHYIQSFIALYPAIDLPPHACLKFALFMACARCRPVVVSDPATLTVLQTVASQLDNTAEIQLLRKRLNKAAVKKVARYLKNTVYQKSFRNYLDPWSNDRLLEGLAHCNAYLSVEEGLSLLSANLLSSAKERDVEVLCRLYVVKMAAEAFRFGQVEKSKDEMEMDCAEFVMFGLNLLNCVREYKKAKKYYAEQNADHLCTELDNLKNQLNDRDMEIRKLHADLAAKNNLLVMKEAEINNLALRQKFMISSTGKEQEFRKTKQDSPGAVKSTLSGITPLPITTATTPALHSLGTDASLKALENIQALVIGGAENWQIKLKNKLPHFIYLQGDITGFDEALVIHADIIFANVRCKFSHDCFYKLVKVVRQYEKRLVFLSKTNIPLTLRQMASATETYAITKDNSNEYDTTDCAVKL